eukprot:501345-Rhodomonas_salina.1
MEGAQGCFPPHSLLLCLAQVISLLLQQHKPLLLSAGRTDVLTEAGLGQEFARGVQHQHRRSPSPCRSLSL